jgi:hypothetical protein
MFKRALLLRISHYMFRLLIKPSSGESNRILKVVVTDPLLKSIELTIYITDGHYENQYSLGKR